MAKVLVRVNERGIRIGESHPRAKLSDADVEILRQDRDRGLSLGALALKWGLSKSGVKAICDGRSRGQIGPTIDAAPTKFLKVKKVQVRLSIPLHVRAKLHRLGGSAWVTRKVEEAMAAKTTCS
jgi:hypothetical protein